MKKVPRAALRMGKSVQNTPWQVSYQCSRLYNSSSNPIIDVKIGLEIHAQIASTSKLFSACEQSYGKSPNTRVALFDAAMPGTLPVLNKHCVEQAALTAMSLNCKINHESHFDRKNYFYSDLPIGYQITQKRKPIAVNGNLNYWVYDFYKNDLDQKPYKATTAITRLQLEQDSGKSLLMKNKTLVDLNRAGTALMEIVTDPSIRSPVEAMCFLRELIELLRVLGTCNGEMQKGELRVDANVSVAIAAPWTHVHTEVKNINSARHVRAAIEYEIARQSAILQNGGKVIRETLGFDINTGHTMQMRDKETLQDYRYNDEPNLPRLLLNYDPKNRNPNLVNLYHIEQYYRTQAHKQPMEHISELMETIGIKPHITFDLIEHKHLRSFFNACYVAIENKSALKPLSVLLHENLTFRNRVKGANSDEKLWPIDPENLILACSLVADNKVTLETVNKLLLKECKARRAVQKNLYDIICENKLFVITDHSDIRNEVEMAFQRNPQVIEQYITAKGKVAKINKLKKYMIRVTSEPVDFRIPRDLLECEIERAFCEALK